MNKKKLSPEQLAEIDKRIDDVDGCSHYDVLYIACTLREHIIALETAMPVGTIILIDDTDSWPDEKERYAFRKPVIIGDVFIGWGILQSSETTSAWVGCIWWPIPKGMFEPPIAEEKQC